MSRSLGIDRATCQRIVGATSKPDASLQTLVQFPGVEGLRQFVAALASRHTDQPAVERLAATGAAIDRFEMLLDELGGSQRRLKERLEAGRPDHARPAMRLTADDERTREALFRAAAEVTGRWAATTVSTSIIQPLPGDPTKTETARIYGLIGYEWRDQSVPLELASSANLRSSEAGPAFASLDSTPATGATPGLLVSEFCSKPLPRVTARAAGSRVLQVFDVTGHHDGHAVDIVTGLRVTAPDKHPATMRPPQGEVWALQNVATRRLVFDTFLHRDIARRCIPSVELHLWAPDASGRASTRWSTRFPGGPRLEVLSPGLRNVGTPSYERCGDLLAHVFGRLGWNAEEFIGYRCEVAFPVWRAGYCMLFDFSGNEIE